MMRVTARWVGGLWLVAVGVLWLFSGPVLAGGTENMLPNPGFEEALPFSVPEKWKERGILVEATEVPAGCGINPLYREQPGKLTVAVDPTASRAGAKYIILDGRMALIHGRRFPCAPEEKYTFSVWARGRGKLRLFAYLYHKFRDPFSNINKSFEVKNEEEWKQYTMILTLPKAVPDDVKKTVAHFCVAYHTEGRVELDDALLVKGETAGSVVRPDRSVRPAYGRRESRPSMTVTKTPTPPVIDGEIGDEEWKFASAVTGFVDVGGHLTGDDTAFYVTYDEKNLYLAFRSTVPGGPRAEGAGRDGEIWEADVVEILLQPDPNDPTYFQFAGNCKGVFYDARGKDGAWNREWRFANKVEDSGERVGGILTYARSLWTGEVAISFEQLGVRPPADGDVWRVNFARDWDERKRPEHMKRWTVWSSTRGTFHNPERWGEVRFRDKAPAIRVLSLGDLVGGDIRISADVHNAAPGPAALEGRLVVRLPESGKEVLRKKVPLTLAPSADAVLQLEETVGLIEPLPLELLFTVANAATRQELHRNVLTFTARPSFRLATTLLYGRKQLLVEIDVSRLPNLPEKFHVAVDIPNSKSRDLPTGVDGLDAANRKGTCLIDMPFLRSGDYVLKAFVEGPEGIVAQRNSSFSIPERPEWLGNKLGVSATPPPPWTPVKVRRKSVSVWGRTYKFSRLALPSAIVNQGRDFLAGPMALEAVVDGKPVRWRGQSADVDPFKRDPDSQAMAVVLAECKGGQIESSGICIVEFDGFMMVVLTVTSKQAVTLEGLRLRIPIRAENALYMRGLRMPDATGRHASYNACLYDGARGRDGDTLTFRNHSHFSARGWIWPKEPLYYLWVGGDSTGLSVSFDSHEGFQTTKHVEVVERQGVKEIVLNFVDSPLSLEKPMTYIFGLHATPVKPLPRDPKRWHFGAASGIDMRDYAGVGAVADGGGLSTTIPNYPELKNKRRPEIFRKAGVRLGTYFSPTHATVETEEFTYFGREWEVVPRRRWHGGDPRYTWTAVSLHGSRVDYYLWGFNKLIDQGLTAMYLDSGGIAASINPYAGAEYEDRDGQRQPTLGLFEAREAYKRIYTLAKSRDPGFFIIAHGVPISPLASFTDGTTQGEAWETEPDYSLLTPDFFRAAFFSRTGYGVPFSFFPSKEIKRGHPLEGCFALTLVHNVYPYFVGRQAKELKPVWDIMDDWRLNAEWIPYWRSGEMVESFHESVKVSLYRKTAQRRVLLVAANLGQAPLSGKLKLRTNQLGLGKGRIRVTRLRPKAEAMVSGETLQVALQPNGVQFFLLETR